MYTADHFQPHLNSEFTVKLSDGSLLRLMLQKIVIDEKKDKGEPQQGRDPFTLVLHTPVVTDLLEHALYTLQHEALGEVTLFLLPRGPVDGAMTYDSIFN